MYQSDEDEANKIPTQRLSQNGGRMNPLKRGDAFGKGIQHTEKLS